jgi:hypothetical protein
MNYNWTNFDEGRSIGQKGSEGGKIVRDEENTFGARVTLEQKGNVAPFSITLGIYGLMFHTKFLSTAEQGQRCFELYKEKIEMVIHHYLVEELERNEEWRARRNEIIDEILNVGM